MAKKTKKHRNDNTLPATLFLLMCLIGIIGIFITKFVNLISHLSYMTQWLPTIVAVVCIFIYVFLSVALPGAKTRLDQTGDNAYYMGFIFTLVSLSLSLVFFEDGTAGIISSFGVAIFSTLVGIIVRTFLHQFRFDPDDIETASRVELSEATRRIRGELDDTILQLQDFRRNTIQSMNEGFEEIRTNVEKLSNSLLEEITNLAQKAQEPIDQLSKDLTKSLDGLTQEMTKISDSFSTSVDSQKSFSEESERATEALRKFADNVEKNDAVTQNLTDSIDKKVQSIGERINTNVSEQNAEISKVITKELNQIKKVVKKSAGRKTIWPFNLLGKKDGEL